jgi:hypothetical protein
MTTIRPLRLQLSREAGFDLQAYSIAMNGLPAVNVARPSRWGNPFKVGIDGDAAECVRLYREFCLGEINRHLIGLGDLRWRNLACWCAPDAPCHADVLLELANR